MFLLPYKLDFKDISFTAHVNSCLIKFIKKIKPTENTLKKFNDLSMTTLPNINNESLFRQQKFRYIHSISAPCILTISAIAQVKRQPENSATQISHSWDICAQNKRMKSTSIFSFSGTKKNHISFYNIYLAFIFILLLVTQHRTPTLFAHLLLYCPHYLPTTDSFGLFNSLASLLSSMKWELLFVYWI